LNTFTKSRSRRFNVKKKRNKQQTSLTTRKAEARKRRKEREREKELDSLAERLRHDRAHEAKARGWDLWGWVRENKHSLTSESARKRIDELVDFSVSEAYDRMVEALDLADQRNTRAKAAEAISVRSKKNVSAYRRRADAAESKLKTAIKRLEHAYEQMVKNGLALPKVAEQILGHKVVDSADKPSKKRRRKTPKVGSVGSSFGDSGERPVA
jgi:hypothetical protein